MSRKVVPVALSYTGTFAALSFAPTYAGLVGLGGYLIPYVIKWLNPIAKSPLREFDPETLDSIAGKYISYYNVGYNCKSGPNVSFIEHIMINFSIFEKSFLCI